MMNFTTDRQTLASAAAFVSRAVRANPDRPVLANVRLESKGDRLHLYASGGDTSLETVVSIRDATDGVVLAPAKRLSQVLNGFDADEVTLTNIDDQGKTTHDVTLHCGGANVTLRGEGPESFPKASTIPAHKVDVDAKAFVSALAQALPAASTDESRPALTGVLLAAHDDGLRITATDSYRLVVRDLKGASVLEAGQKVLVPASALSEVSRLGDVDGNLTLHLGEAEVVIEAGTNRLRTRLLKADYPDVERLLPSGSPKRTATVNRTDLASAVKLAGLMVTGASPVRLDFEAGSVTVTSKTDEVGSIDKTVDAKLDGEPTTLAFNHEYVGVALNAFPGDEVHFEANEPAQPVVIRDDAEPGLLYLIMPIRAGS
jgi:DNA polymerase-3 subunit beta